MVRVLLFAIVSAIVAAPQMPQADAEAALANAEKKWAANKPKAYEFTINVVCFCAVAKDPPVFRVSDGVASTAASLTDGQKQLYGNFDTIEKQFSAIRRGLQQKPFKIDLKFDPQMGYPTHVRIDPRENIADDELIFDVRKFRSADSSFVH